MKILHICLANYYKEDMGYQENLITKAHKKLGHDVYIFAPASRIVDGKNVFIEDDYVNANDIPVTIIKNKTGRVAVVLKIYEPFVYKVEELNPDVIFVHGGQSMDLLKIKKYCKKHPNCRLYVDQHADYYNNPIRPFKRKIIVKYVHGFFIRHNMKYVTRFWGTTPWRCDYLHEVYGVPYNKIGLLIMGGDDDKIHFDLKEKIRQSIRDKYNINKDDFLIVTGGKIDRTKNIHLLVEAITKLNNPSVKLLIFGNLTEDMQVKLEKYTDSDIVKFAGWIPSDEAYNYFLASDLAVFPGTHSVLWEQACACGVPIVVKDWKGMHHVDLGGNCKFLKEDTVVEIYNVVDKIVNSSDVYNAMYNIAQEKCIKEFSYRDIALRAIDK